MADTDVISVHIEEKDKTEIKKAHTPKKTVIQNLLFWQLLSFFLIIVVIVSFFVIFRGESSVSETEAKAKVQLYVDTVLKGQELQAQLGDITQEHGLYVLEITLDNQAVKTYLSPDGVLFFPSAIDLDRFNALLGSFTPPVGGEGIQEVPVVPSAGAIEPVEETSVVSS